MSLVDLGEEYILETALGGVSLDVGLYNQSTDSLGETSDVSDITTEPAGSAYARQTSTYSLSDESGDWGIINDSLLSFDTTDSSQTVDSYFIVANFQADDTGDSGANDHLVGFGALKKDRNLSDIDTLDVDAGTAGLTVT